MKILITGSKGFIAQNLLISLKKNPELSLFELGKKDNKKLFNYLNKVDAVFHLAGVNRSNAKKDFFQSNSELTKKICDHIIQKKLKLKFFYPSTIHVNKNNFYGMSKKKAEESVQRLKKKTKCRVFIYRLPNVFGKGCRPFYNSVIATFCHQLSRNKKVSIKNSKEIFNFLYIDDLIESFIKNLFSKSKKISKFTPVPKSQKISIDALYKLLKSFQMNFDFAKLYKQKPFLKKLYSVYLSYLPAKKIVNFKDGFHDNRGDFFEILKSQDIGQISYLSIKPGETRGNHYHNTKVELFFLVSGFVKFNIQNIFSKKKITITLKEGKKIPSILTQPGFAHNIVNYGKKDAKFIIWSNEIYNIKKPDTHIYKVGI
tara:strand:+ start:689 stop:1801 length:1113 start_codon:yes stop_codon:yes gene_type:complete